MNWACEKIINGFSSPSLNILASLEEPLNNFEVKQFFGKAIEELQLYRTFLRRKCEIYVQFLLQRIILDHQKAIESAYEIYQVLREHSDNEQLYTWYEISEMIDDFQYGDNINNFTRDFLIGVIEQEAKKQLSNR